jgi:hypothetical protein
MDEVECIFGEVIEKYGCRAWIIRKTIFHFSNSEFTFRLDYHNFSISKNPIETPPK